MDKARRHILVNKDNATLLFRGHEISKYDLALPWGYVSCATYKTDDGEFVSSIEYYVYTTDKLLCDFKVCETLRDATEYYQNTKEKLLAACNKRGSH